MPPPSEALFPPVMRRRCRVEVTLPLTCTTEVVPVPSRVVLAAGSSPSPAPTRVKFLVMEMFSAYVPAHRVTAEPAVAASIAACTKVKGHPLAQTSQRQAPLKHVPCWLLHAAQGAPPAPHAAALVPA